MAPWMNVLKPNCFRIAVLTAGLIGSVAWRGCTWLISLTVFVPLLVFIQDRRRDAAAVAIAYFAAASWPLIEACHRFTESATLSPLPFLLWTAASILLSLPWFLAWTRHRHQRIWRTVLALAVSVVPPLGLISWASPLTTAGVLFPGTAWFGLFATAMLPGLLAWSRKPLLVASLTATVAVICNLLHREPRQTNDWETVNMALASNRFQPTANFLAGQSIQNAALRSTAAVVVFPEAVIARWNLATEAFWQPTLLKLAHDGKTAVIGAGLPIEGTSEYLNAAVIIGPRAQQPFIQRIPVPLGMWKPFGPPNGVPLMLTGRGTADFAGERVAILICYEQLLVWPILHSAVEQPTVLVGMANQYWTRKTSIPAAQRACLKAWARLFALPLLTADNI